MIRSASRLLLAALVTLGAGGLAAQAPATTEVTADQVIARYVAALGGRQALERVTAQHTWGVVEIPAQGLKGTLEAWSAPPDRLRVFSEIPGLGSSTTGFDGETGWTLSTAMGPMLLEGRALDQLKQQALFNAPLHAARYIASREVVGPAEFAGRACWQLKVRTTWDEEYMEYYDRETGLLAGTVRKQETPMGGMDATTTLENWRTVSGIKTPALVRVRVMGMEQIVRTDSTSTAPIPDSVFALPPEIRSLKKGS